MEEGRGRDPACAPGMVVRQAPPLFHDCEVDQPAAFAMYSRAQSPSTFADGYAARVIS